MEFGFNSVTKWLLDRKYKPDLLFTLTLFFNPLESRNRFRYFVSVVTLGFQGFYMWIGS